MSDFKLDSTGDIEVIDGIVSLTSGIEAKRQHLEQRLKLFFREWFLDQSRGIPYFQHIFVKNPNPVIVDAIFKTEILNTPGILKLDFFELDLNETTRELTLSFRAITIEGEINFSEILGIL